MARRKATQKKSGKQAAPKTIVQAPKFPADLLPSELIHLVFTYLQPTEAAAFRWVGRIVAEIGLQYLAPTIYLALKEESYNRLLAIAEHPIVSKYVVKLVFETRGLGSINREQLDGMIRDTRVIPPRHDSERPDSFASARAWRAYDRETVRNLPLTSQRKTRQSLSRAWSLHEAYRTDGKKVQNANFFREKTAEAMRHLRNLKSIFTSTDGAYERYASELKEILPTYYISYRDYGEDSLDFDPTSSVMLAAESAGLHIDNFCSQPFNWQVFRHNDKDLTALNRSMLHVRFLNMALTVQRDLGQHRMIREIEFIRRECLAKGRMLDLLTSAPNLEFLELTFATRPQIYPTIYAFVGDFHWSSLKAVVFDNIATYEYDLVDFCERHSHTLKDLSLTDVLSFDVSWDVIFHSVRRAFRLGQQLHTCKLGGRFSKPGILCYPMDFAGEGNIPLGILISDYIRATYVGDISLGEYYEFRGLRYPL